MHIYLPRSFLSSLPGEFPTLWLQDHLVACYTATSPCRYSQLRPRKPSPSVGTEPWCSQLSRSLLYFRHFSSSNIGSYGRRIGITMNTFRTRRHRHSRRKPAFSRAHTVVLRSLLLWPNEMSFARMYSSWSLIYTSFLIQEVHLKCYAPWDSFSTSA